MIKLTIADSQPAVLYGLKTYLKNHHDTTVVDFAKDLTEVNASLKSKPVDVLIIDLEIDGLNSIRNLSKIYDDFPKTKLLVYTNASEKLFGVTSLKAGASGFISKKQPLSALAEAVQSVFEGKKVFSEFVQKSLHLTSRKNRENRLYRKLSIREREVLHYFINGKKNNEISVLLGLNEKTISTYKLRLLSKLEVTNLVDLVNKAKTLEIM